MIQKLNLFENHFPFCRCYCASQEHRSFIFKPELSDAKQYDQVTVPNIPYLTAVSELKHDWAWKRAVVLTGKQPFIVSVQALIIF